MQYWVILNLISLRNLQKLKYFYFLMLLNFRNGITFVGRSPNFARSTVAITVEDEEEHGALAE
jgi:hypothetical protein